MLFPPRSRKIPLSILPNPCVHHQVPVAPQKVSFAFSALILSFSFFSAVHSAQENSMSAEATGRAPLMPLRELVRLYRSQSGSFGEAVPLSAFGLTRAETERLFSGYDEDYHISRFFQFSEGDGEKFSINGILATHVALDAEIQTIL
jgi:hypothetical protein